MRRHWSNRHYDEFFNVPGETGYDKCDRCMKYVHVDKLVGHQRTGLCSDGNRRRKSRELIAAASLPAPTFYVGDATLEQVTQFRYLGRIISEDDNDVPTCLRNIQRAKAKWAAISRVLKRDGASQRAFARFYLVIVNTVLLYASDTWVVTQHMQDMLEAFHNRCARHITRRYIRYVDATEEWITPSTEGVLREAGLKPIMHYVCKRRNGLLSRFLSNRTIYAECQAAPKPTRHRPTFWKQDDYEIK
jgi:hypothetical protein